MNQFALGRPWIMFFWASDTTTLAAATPSTPVDPHKTTRDLLGAVEPATLYHRDYPGEFRRPVHPRPYLPAHLCGRGMRFVY